MRVPRSYFLDLMKQGASIESLEVLEQEVGAEGIRKIVLRVVLSPPRIIPIIDSEGNLITLGKSTPK